MTMRRMPVLAQSVGCTGSPCLSQPGSSPADPTQIVSWLLGPTDPSSVPGSVSVIPSMTQDMGFYKNYYYQLNNLNGVPLTGPGYQVTEWITGENPGDINSNGQYSTVVNGVIGPDRTGFTDSPPDEPYVRSVFQNFTVSYQGVNYDLSTVFMHTTTVTGPPYTVTINTTTVVP
jgi:hypothetical protein